MELPFVEGFFGNHSNPVDPFLIVSNKLSGKLFSFGGKVVQFCAVVVNFSLIRHFGILGFTSFGEIYFVIPQNILNFRNIQFPWLLSR